MQIFFVIDTMKDLDKKISLLRNNLGENFKFFVNTQKYLEINGNEFILNNLAGIYENNEIKKIDEYIKSDKFELDEIFLYYASVEIEDKHLQKLSSLKSFNYDVVYFGNNSNKFKNCVKKVYQTTTKFIFGTQDPLWSDKIQYISKNIMQNLQENMFNNHIFHFEKSTFIQLNQDSNKPVKNINKKVFISAGLLEVLLLSLYIILAINIKLRFYVHFLIIMLLLAIPIVSFIWLINMIFSARFKFTNNKKDT